MRLHGTRMSGASRYHARNSGVKRSSTYSRSSARTTNRYKALFAETKEQLGETEKTDKTENTEQQSSKSSVMSKYARTKAKTYTATGSRFNDGASAVSGGIKEMDAILSEDAPDMEKAYSAAKEFADGYNELYSAVSSSAIASVSKKTDYLDEVTGMFSRRLDKVGISVGKDGKLSVDKDKLMNAEKSDLSAVFGKKSSYAAMISEQADNIGKISAAAQTSGTTAYGSSGSAFGGSFFNSKF